MFNKTEMIKVVPYIDTCGTIKYKKLLKQSFHINMLFRVCDDENNVKLLFDNWVGKNMVNWYKFTNSENIILEFYPNHYIINKQNIKQSLPLPLTVNDFINDMNRLNINLYWSKTIEHEYEPKDYLSVDTIKTYYVQLMNKMNKSFELN